MKTVFEYNNLKVSDYLRSFTLNKLDGIIKKYPFAIKADVFFNKEVKDREKGNICSIRLSLPGPRIYASSNKKTFRNAVNNAIKDLNDQLEKRKAILYKNYS